VYRDHREMSFLHLISSDKRLVIQKITVWFVYALNRFCWATRSSLLLSRSTMARSAV
jgi:hypothetical protein